MGFDEVPVAVDEDMIHCDTEPADGPLRRKLLGCRHAEFVALGLACMGDADMVGPFVYPVEHDLALSGSEHLGVTHLVEPLVTRHDDGSQREWPSPGPAADLVDADDDLIAGIPTCAFDP